MREVRMTFGEHLEELRTRVLISLLYLAAGVTIAFIYGNQLLDLALGPHEKAFRGAQRNRQIQRMGKYLDAIEPLAGPQPTDAELNGRPLIDAEDFHWEALFPAEVARARIREALEGPYQDLESQLAQDFPNMAPGERAMVGRLLDAHERASAILVEHLTTDFQLSGGASIPDRFRELEARLRTLRDEESVGVGSMKRLVGWGADLEPVLERLTRFNRFLDKRRIEVTESPASLVDLRAWSSDLHLSEGLEEVVSGLQSSVDALTHREPKRIVVLDYTEHFTAYLKIAMIFGLFLSVPFILYEMWKFVGAGLHLHEQRYVVTFMPFSLALFASGALFGYFVLIPVGLEFLASWGETDIEMNFALGNYIGLFLTLTLILGVVFQTPLLMVFLNKIGIVSVAVYRRARRIAIFGGVCLAVVLTPPDPFSWSLMALPMILLYELGILVCSLLSRRESPQAVP